MNTRTLLAILLGMILGWGCKDAGSDPTPSPSALDGALSYTSYNNAGRIEETGWLVLDTSNPEHVKGIWRLSIRGFGELAGSMENDRVVVDLHPGNADNNYILDGMVQGGNLSGSWTQIGFAGIMASGRFEAHPR